MEKEHGVSTQHEHPIQLLLFCEPVRLSEGAPRQQHLHVREEESPHAQTVLVRRHEQSRQREGQ